MKKIMFFVFAFLISMSFIACKKEDNNRAVNVVKHPTEVIVTERFQDYEDQGGYYIAVNTTDNEKFLYLTAKVKDLVTGEFIEAYNIEWYGYPSLIGKGEFKPSTGSVTRYEPVKDSEPQEVCLVVAYRGSSKYLPDMKYFDVYQNGYQPK